MKKWLSVVLPAALLMTVPGAALPASAAGDVYTPSTISLFTLEDKEKPTEITCLYREELPGIPYISVEDYLDQLFTVKIKAEDNGDGTFTYTNDKYHLVVDTGKDTISFDFCEGFVFANKKPFSDAEDSDYIKDAFSLEPIGELNGFAVDLSRYDIDLTAADGKAYIPFCTVSDLFADTGCGLQKREDGLHVLCPYEEMLAGEGNLYEEKTTRSKAEAEFCYRELCFTIDCLTGKPTRALLCESLREKGLDETLRTTNGITVGVRDLLLSESMEDYCKGIRLLDLYLDDGGHTGLSRGLSYLMKELKTPGAAEIAAEKFGVSCPDEVAEIAYLEKTRQEKQARISSIFSEKEGFLETMELIKSWDSAAFYHDGDTYWFTFNSFRDSVVPLFKWSMDYAAAHNAKNFVIDLSTNSGGSMNVGAYMMSLVSGNVDHVEQIALTGNRFVEDLIVDKNLDGKFDEQDDALHYDFHVAMLTSQFSYSMGNQLPCTAQDHGLCIIGENSAGGTFNISPRYYPDGALYSTSGSMGAIRANGEDADLGVTPAEKLPGLASFYDGFYDLEAINAAVSKFYGEDYDKELLVQVAENVSKAENKLASEQQEERRAFESRRDLLKWLIPCAAAGAVLAIAAILIVVVRRKAKRQNKQKYSE